MNITVSGKNGMAVTDGLRDAVIKNVSKLSKYFPEDTEVRTVLSVQKNNHIAEITIPFKGIIFRAEEVSDDMYVSIDRVVDKIEKQILKHKAKLKNRFGSNESIRFEIPPAYEEAKGEEEEGSFEIVKTKRFPIKPMSPEEAILQMNLLGHNFFVFTNADTDTINVVYKRKDGKYGLIEPLE
ncbi:MULTISPECIES: ribosome hibernation-promoting factor, HPF/YfiA family [Thermoanaerobacter]|uniref:Ribosome hibernation promoting factor n=2 Tax=Thermoanaerobacter TaxID=1754 RepID=B0KBV4_THEP3|nr:MULTISPECIES: ribosome-associated translation inhibitor RaiA [Thermoanaerobacter]ABY95399.1 sigma 54 modulation protein/ribosomal protein S30EA [Thermoanaerobacter pseudethanolicus ATCC 33223]ADV80342.1 ribosomal subunit interface protein [Thermoanaerobacter brockii subsp. finnii Ako-1]HBW59714.1 ribosome-associated translation inhibitor RaiA [Thermoanaerobacter sp.]